MYVIKVVSKINLEDVLNNPADFVNSSDDMVLIEIKYLSGSVYIMLGQDDNGRFYLTAEDDETFRDYYLKSGETLVDKFKWLTANINEYSPFPEDNKEIL